MHNTKRYNSFKSFYPFYLSQHQNKTCRLLHYVGSGMALCWIIMAIIEVEALYLVLALVNGYLCAWVGHLFFEKNKPATFTYPWYSFLGDWYMLLNALKKKR